MKEPWLVCQPTQPWGPKVVAPWQVWGQVWGQVRGRGGNAPALPIV